MGRKSAYTLAAIFILSLFPGAGPVSSENAMLLGLCQELVNRARVYEARAAGHSRTSKALMQQIENAARLPKNQNTIAAVDNLFGLYDQHRSMELKYMELYRKAAEEAKKCMKSVE